jgi:hypothetical protein
MHQLVDLRLRVLPETSRCERPIVPVISEDESVKTERIAGNGSIDGAATSGVRLKSFTSTTAAHFILLSAADEIVFVGIEREQDPEVPLWVHMKHDQIAIVLGSHLNLGAVAGEEAAVIADPKTDRRIVLGGGRRIGGRSSEHQRKEQRGNHGTSQQPRLQRGKYDGTLTSARTRLLGRCCEPRAMAYELEI